MAGVMTMRSGNPALTADTFAKYRAVTGAEQMTLGGTVNKTALSLVILLVAAGYVWNRGAADPSLGASITVSAVAGLVVAMVTAFKQTLAPYTTPVYAALEGGRSVESRWCSRPGTRDRQPGRVLHVWDAGRAARGVSVRHHPGHGELQAGRRGRDGRDRPGYLLGFVLGFFGVAFR